LTLLPPLPRLIVAWCSLLSVGWGCSEATSEGIPTLDIGADASETDTSTCEVSTDCDDQNPCTADLCNTGTCAHQSLEGKTCDDGDACTEADACSAAGVCVGATGVALPDDPCVTCTCDPAGGLTCTASAVGDACDDQKCCTTGDECQACPKDEPGCNEYGRVCSGAVVTCDDGDECSTDACGCNGRSPNCEHAKAGDGTPCDFNSNDCTVGDACKAGVCTVGPPMDLDDKNPCTKDVCIKGQVEHQPMLEGQCDDENECTENDHCVLGTCVVGTPVQCVVGPCAADAECIQGQGCVTTWKPVGASCGGNDSCAATLACDAEHACTAAGPWDCDDGDPCTVDTCDAGPGTCTHVAAKDGTPCEDQNECTENDHCVLGTCVVGTPVQCVVGPCAADAECIQGQGCVTTWKPVGASCAGNDPCAATLACDAEHACKAAGGPSDCDDGDPCTLDTCDAGSGTCTHVAAKAGTPCEDGDLCSVGDSCIGGACHGSPRLCCDGDDCTTDACDPAVGCVFAAIAGCGECVSQPVVLDPSFGDAGSATFYAPGCDYDTTAHTVAQQSDGKFVLGGQFYDKTYDGRIAVLSRVHFNGTLDTSFGVQGWLIPLPDLYSRVSALHILPDGRILGGGDMNPMAMILRLNSDGTLDTSFADGKGYVKHPSMVAAGYNRDHLAVDEAGRYLIGGSVGIDFGVARYTPEGALDAGFGSGGTATLSATEYPAYDVGHTLLLQPDGKIVVGGVAGLDFGLARWEASGAIDLTFGKGGFQVTDVVNSPTYPDQIHALALGACGSILAVGCGDCFPSYNHDTGWALVRYLSDGQLDPSWGGTGVVFDPIPPSLVSGPGISDGAMAVLVLPDGKVLAAGSTHFNAAEGRMLLARYRADGSLDTCFDGDGYYVQNEVTGPGTSQSDYAWDLLLEPAGSVIVAGTQMPSFIGYQAIFRINP
jgi:uncharacterized delta-60 repeat protein